MLTTTTRGVPRASKNASFGVTAQTAKSIAFAGPGDGKAMVSQAGEVAAYAQTSQSSFDQWQTNPSDKTKNWVGTESGGRS